ncbi:MAG: hypothetical protein DDT26_00041 [Dehalococcoidia bacterium]|nr:hypothetical protein [Chloroflexota bacterium]
MIIIPYKRFVELNDPLNSAGEVQGWFKIEALKVDAHGRPIEQSRRVLADWFPNLITNFGINGIGTLINLVSFCRVGSGNATPQFTDSQLQSQIASTNTLQASAEINGGTPPNYFHGRNTTFRFPTGAAAGNISEVGVGQTETGATLFSRALILDAGLNPATITVLSDEVLDVTYQSRWYPPNADQMYNITIVGVGSIAVTARASRVTSATNYFIGRGGIWPVPSAAIAQNGTIGPVTGSPSGAGAAASAVANLAYSNNSLQVSFSMTFGLNNGNLSGGISALSVALGDHSGCYGYMQYGLSPAIPKLNTQILTINGVHSWARR